MLSQKSSRTGSIVALYRGLSRVGYIFERQRGGYTWELRLLRPQGGHYVGETMTLDQAHEAAERAFADWLTETGLREA